MKKLIIATVTTVFLLSLCQAFAQDVDSGPKTKTLSATLTTTLANVTTGECANAGYASQCPSGNCRCFIDNAATIFGTMAGKGSVTVAGTEDLGLMVPVSAGTTGS